MCRFDPWSSTASGYRVHLEPIGSGRGAFDAPLLWVDAEVVILAAGALGTTEILLRSRGAGLPASAKIGDRFSADGGLLSFAFDCAEPINSGGLGDEPPDPLNPIGPGITGTIDFRGQAKLDDGWVVQEGSHPIWMTHSSFRWYGLKAWMSDEHPESGALEWMRRQTRFLEAVVGTGRDGALRRTMDWLVIGHDSGDGRLRLEDDRVRISWPGFRESRLSWSAVHDKLRAYTKALGGSYLTAETMFTTHPLGGCVMADRAEDGVVNHKGQVFCRETGSEVHQGLYVCDGAAIPRSLGINPLLTISAVAERSVALLARDRGWAIEYGYAGVSAPAADSRPARTGFAFTETLRGRATSSAVRDGARTAESALDLVVTIECDDIESLLASPPHTAPFFGTVSCPLLSPHPLMIEDGLFDLVAREASSQLPEMRYRMSLVAREGRRFSLAGHKELAQSGGLDVWTDATTLFVSIHEEESLVARGVVNIEPTDFVRQLSTWRAKRGTSVIDALTTVARVGSFLGRNIAQGSLEASRSSRPPPQESNIVALAPHSRPHRAPEEHPFPARDGVSLRLRRFPSTGAPVVLAHCAGVSSDVFTTTPGAETSLAVHLADRGFDVWLLDLRTSSALDASRRPYDLDDVARHDYPAALEYVIRATGNPAAHVVAHGVGGVALLMSLLGGYSEGLVRSAICIQTALHFRPVNQTLLRTSSTLSDFLSRPSGSGRGPRSLARAALSLYPRPAGGNCADPICRARTIALGSFLTHERVTPAAHEALLGMLATPGARLVAHVDRLGKTGCVVDASGGDTYMPNLERLRLPLSFIHGTASAWFDPKAGATTCRLLSETANGRSEEHVLGDAAHFDLLLARDALKQVLSITDRHLERWSVARAPLSRAG